jgi:hypothetical protein
MSSGESNRRAACGQPAGGFSLPIRSRLDRFLHHATVIAITGRSYRLRNQGRGEASPAAEPALETSKPAIPPAGSATRTKRKKAAAETAEAC